jgi:hypothetical protein
LLDFYKEFTRYCVKNQSEKKRNIYLVGLGIPMEQNYAHLQKAPFSDSLVLTKNATRKFGLWGRNT